MWPASWPLFAIFLILNRCVSATLAHWSWLFELPWILILAKISLKIPKKNGMDVSKNGCFFSMDASLASDLGNFQCMWCFFSMGKCMLCFCSMGQCMWWCFFSMGKCMLCFCSMGQCMWLMMLLQHGAMQHDPLILRAIIWYNWSINITN